MEDHSGEQEAGDYKSWSKINIPAIESIYATNQGNQGTRPVIGQKRKAPYIEDPADAP